MAETLPLPAAEHGGLLQQLKDAFDEGRQSSEKQEFGQVYLPTP